jgi:hypothetical protein
MIGFKIFGNAEVTLSGIELANKIKKGQFDTSVCLLSKKLHQNLDYFRNTPTRPEDRRQADPSVPSKSGASGAEGIRRWEGLVFILYAPISGSGGGRSGTGED